MNSKTVTRWMAAVVLLAGAGATARAHDHEGGAAATMDGEIVDLQCFMGHPETGQGKEHAACAQACMTKGLPIGFLSGGQVYLLLSEEHEPVKAKVAKLAGVPVTLTGTVIDHHGMKAIAMKDVKKAGAAMAAAAKPDKPATAKDVWVCPMGCEGKKFDKAGKCPVCGMDLVKQKS